MTAQVPDTNMLIPFGNQVELSRPQTLSA